MVDGPNVYAYAGGHVQTELDRMGLTVRPDNNSLLDRLGDWIACARQVANEVMTPTTHAIPNDNNKHCRIGCEISRICGGGMLGAAIVNIWYEIDTNLAGGDSIEDTFAAAVGGHYGSSLACDDVDSCGQKCDKRFNPSHGPDDGQYN